MGLKRLDRTLWLNNNNNGIYHILDICGSQFYWVTQASWPSWDCNLKNDRIIKGCFQGKPCINTVIQVYTPNTDADEAEADKFYDDLKHLLELRKSCPSHHRELEYKSTKLRDTQNNRQFLPWTTKWSSEKDKRALSREHVGHNEQPFPTNQEMTLHMDITMYVHV